MVNETEGMLVKNMASVGVRQGNADVYSYWKSSGVTFDLEHGEYYPVVCY